jgi:hypothetical protein
MTWTQYGSFGAVGCSSDQHTLVQDECTDDVTSNGESDEADGACSDEHSGSSARICCASPQCRSVDHGHCQQDSGSQRPLATLLWASAELAAAADEASALHWSALHSGVRYYAHSGLRAAVDDEGTMTICDRAGTVMQRISSEGESTCPDVAAVTPSLYHVTHAQIRSSRRIGPEIQLSVGSMGVQLFDGPRFLSSLLYQSMLGGWEYAPSEFVATRYVRRDPYPGGTLRIMLRRLTRTERCVVLQHQPGAPLASLLCFLFWRGASHFASSYSLRLRATGEWQTGNKDLRVFHVASKRDGEQMAAQMKANNAPRKAAERAAQRNLENAALELFQRFLTDAVQVAKEHQSGVASSESADRGGCEPELAQLKPDLTAAGSDADAQ